MNGRLSRNQKWIAVLSAIAVVLILAGCYFFILHPQKVELDKRKAELRTEETLLKQLNTQLNQKSAMTYASTVSLQKQIPVKPLLERFILDIEKAEVLSGCLVKDFSVGEKSGIEEVEMTEMGETGAEAEENMEAAANTEQTVEESAEQPSKTGDTVLLPSGFRKVSINLTVSAPGYYELEEFINILERAERIMTVENIKFSGPDEVVSLEDESGPLELELVVSAYYMPGLTELIHQLPRIDSPTPGNKTNPLATFGDSK